MSLLSNIIFTIKDNDTRLKWEEYFMSIAYLISSRSTCSRLKVGCVLVRDNRIISVGYNGFFSGCPHNSIVVDNHEQATVHAEQNAIADCAKRGVNVNSCTAYITHYPCINCTKILFASGIKNIIYNEDYNNNNIIIELIKDTGLVISKLQNLPRFT